MSDIELAVKAAKKIETTLGSLGAKGRGLHQKLSCIEAQLPETLVKRIRYIATLRNRLVHDEAYSHLEDRPAFRAAVKQVRKELNRMERYARVRWRLGWVFLIFVLISVLYAGWG